MNSFWILTQRRIEKQLHADKSLFKEKIKIEYWLLGEHKEGKISGFFAGFHNPNLNINSITNEAVYLDPESIRGNHLGTYFMNEIVKWAQQFDNSSICQITL